MVNVFLPFSDKLFVTMKHWINAHTIIVQLLKEKVNKLQRQIDKNISHCFYFSLGENDFNPTQSDSKRQKPLSVADYYLPLPTITAEIITILSVCTNLAIPFWPDTPVGKRAHLVKASTVPCFSYKLCLKEASIKFSQLVWLMIITCGCKE